MVSQATLLTLCLMAFGCFLAVSGQNCPRLSGNPPGGARNGCHWIIGNNHGCRFWQQWCQNNKHCSFGQVWYDCRWGCQPTCSSRSTCGNGCNGSGCQCWPGWFWNGRQCVQNCGGCNGRNCGK